MSRAERTTLALLALGLAAACSGGGKSGRRSKDSDAPQPAGPTTEGGARYAAETLGGGITVELVEEPALTLDGAAQAVLAGGLPVLLDKTGHAAAWSAETKATQLYAVDVASRHPDQHGIYAVTPTSYWVATPGAFGIYGIGDGVSADPALLPHATVSLTGVAPDVAPDAWRLVGLAVDFAAYQAAGQVVVVNRAEDGSANAFAAPVPAKLAGDGAGAPPAFVGAGRVVGAPAFWFLAPDALLLLRKVEAEDRPTAYKWQTLPFTATPPVTGLTSLALTLEAGAGGAYSVAGQALALGGGKTFLLVKATDAPGAPAEVPGADPAAEPAVPSPSPEPGLATDLSFTADVKPIADAACKSCHGWTVEEDGWRTRRTQITDQLESGGMPKEGALADADRQLLLDWLGTL